MFQKVLIANRGEIAVRVIRACKELDIQTVAVYSEADEHALHVQLADESICIGAPASKESYLRPERILSAAEVSGADAIHPGYGFLSENPTFAEQCQLCNLTFIGPSALAIKEMGNKARARELAKKAKVPILPGSDGAVRNEQEAFTLAKKIGFPVIIKAVAGGGGQGMRLVHSAVNFMKEMAVAREEASRAFGNGEIYLEKYLESPRHIEFQILRDKKGHTVYFGERDCSIQRRHQKLIEESPSPFVNEALRKTMGKAALHLAQACHYENAGTLEFLVDAQGDFYFLEMNTRLQVEHCITEEITGIDLVKQQILIAQGRSLPFSQSDIRRQGHAIECRINAENIERNFAPSPGTIEFLHIPGGYGIRFDSHIYTGYTIPPYYDSLLGKLISYGSNRNECIQRMLRALNEIVIQGEGIFTTIPLLKRIFQDPLFRDGQANTHYLENFLSRTRI